MNHMREVAELLGVRMGQEFKVHEFEEYAFYKDDIFRITENGVEELRYGKWLENSNILWRLLTNKLQVMKPLLTPSEYKYLKNIIRPFEDQVVAIVKIQDNNGECIKIRVKDNLYPSVILPYFKKGTRFIKMKPNYEYLMENIDL